MNEHDSRAFRILVYRLLSDLFAHPPTSDKISQLAAVTVHQDVHDDPGLDPLFALFADLNKDPARAERDLMGAYAFLFLGAGGPQSVPSSQSAFTDPRGRVCQEPAAAMARHLARLGMHVDTTYPEPPDHIAVILAVTAEMIATGARPADQTAFIKDHLAAWLPAFQAACASHDRHGFYARLAKTTDAFVAADLQWLMSHPSRTSQEEENV